jgi:hypothetical protein
MNRTRMILAASVATLLGAAPMMAQDCTLPNPPGTTCTVSLATSATVLDVLHLNLSTITLDLLTPTEADYTAGFKDATAHPTATVKANRAWAVTVGPHSGATEFGFSGTLTNPHKTASDLVWAKTAGGLGSPFSNLGASATLSSSSIGTDGITASSKQDIFFRTKWFWASDVPGTYSLTVDFTLSAP